MSHQGSSIPQVSRRMRLELAIAVCQCASIERGREMIDTIYRCDICGEENENPVRWIVIQCNDKQLSVFKWAKDAADAPHARHYCGEAHAQVYISRWFESFCG